jgi:uncharacterized protein YpmB
VYIFRDEKGYRYKYIYHENNNTFTTNNKKPIIVTKNEDSITLEYTDGIIETYQEGYLVEKKDKNNNKITLHYDENYLLGSINYYNDNNNQGYYKINYNQENFILTMEWMFFDR